MHTALDTAKYFLSLADEHGDELDQLKLQQLCYYAQGYNLAMRGKPLFSDPIEAWDQGPVVRDLQRRFGHCDANPIPADQSFDRNLFSVMESALLHAVYREFRAVSSSDLAAATRTEAPWCEARKRGGALRAETMRDHFAARIKRAVRAAPTYEHTLDESFARSAADLAAGRYR